MQDLVGEQSLMLSTHQRESGELACRQDGAAPSANVSTVSDLKQKLCYDLIIWVDGF